MESSSQQPAWARWARLSLGQEETPTRTHALEAGSWQVVSSVAKACIGCAHIHNQAASVVTTVHAELGEVVLCLVSCVVQITELFIIK